MLVECPIVVLVLVLVNHCTTPYAAELGAQTETRCEPLTYAYREARNSAEFLERTTAQTAAMLLVRVECVPVSTSLKKPIAPE